MKPTLFIFSGLPASGKTTLSRLLAKSKMAVYHPWRHERTVIDTAERTEKECFEILVNAIGGR
jgi:tRNA uridine 5-carbamoylmethylation protein Kti12